MNVSSRKPPGRHKWIVHLASIGSNQRMPVSYALQRTYNAHPIFRTVTELHTENDASRERKPEHRRWSPVEGEQMGEKKNASITSS